MQQGKYKNIYDFQDYQKYLRDCLPSTGSERGGSSRLALYLGCQLGFVSLVLSGKAHFSLENAVLVSEFLEQSDDERDYFILLVQKARAGSKKLEALFENKIKVIQAQRRQIANRVKDAKQPLSKADQVTYYSHWIYTALHMALLVPHLQKRENLIRFLRVPPKRLTDAIAFMLNTGLAAEKNGRLVIGTTRMHLPADSPLIQRHHMNWRLKAIQSLDDPKLDDLHYSSIMSVSQSGVDEIRELLMRLISEADQVIKKEKADTVQTLMIDFFSLKQEKTISSE